MFQLQTAQKIFDIAGTKVGGQSGEYPTVLIGSIFYDHHRIVSDPIRGEFDRKQAEALIRKQMEMSDKTGNPCFLDTVGSTPEALTRYVDFISTYIDVPFLVDGPSAAVRIPVARHAVEVGLEKKIIYNSIDNQVGKDEIQAIKECGIKSAIILAFNPRNPSPEGRLEVLQGFKGRSGLLEAASEAGIQNLLIDTAVLDVPSIALAAKAVFLVKNEFGLPAGCGVSNATRSWKRVIRGEFGPYAFQVCDGAADLLAVMMGANFVLYGPIEAADIAFPACAMADALNAYNARRYGVKPRIPSHPLFKIF